MENWLVMGSSLAETLTAYFLSKLRGQYADVGKTSSLINDSHVALIAKKTPSDGCLCYFRIRRHEKILSCWFSFKAC